MRLVVDTSVLAGELLRRAGRARLGDDRLELFLPEPRWSEVAGGAPAAHRCVRPPARSGYRRGRSVRRLVDVTRLTIEVDDKVAQRVAEAAAERGVAPEQLAGEVVAERFPPLRKLAFAAIGASGSTKGAAEADELLAEGFGR